MTAPIDLDALERLHADLIAGRSFGVEWNKRLEEDLPALIAELREARRDAERIDYLQRAKSASFRALNSNNAIAAVELFTVPSQHVRGNTVRDAIDAAIDAARAALPKAEP